MSSNYDPLVLEGRFWLPNDRHRSYGRLDHDLEKGVHLHLVDTNLWAHLDDPGEQPQPIDVLHGEGLGGPALTVLDFYPTKWTRHGTGQNAGNTVDGFARRLVRGVHLSEYDDLEAPTV
ncbi:MAG TPA: hypothetical protein VK781_04385, partial [Solirubrobacteraceae bacterium]|nr:hypothetical protein [Solirubrobacteraceae bacterium]